MRLTALIVLLCLPALASAETVYKWTDANGVVHYSQSPPDSGSYSRLQTDVPSGSGTKRSSADSFVRQAEASQSASDKAREAETADKANRAEQCAKARERLATLTNQPPHRFMVAGPDGQPSRMTDEQFQQQLDAAKKDETKNCE